MCLFTGLVVIYPPNSIILIANLELSWRRLLNNLSVKQARIFSGLREQDGENNESKCSVLEDFFSYNLIFWLQFMTWAGKISIKHPRQIKNEIFVQCTKAQFLLFSLYHIIGLNLPLFNLAADGGLGSIESYLVCLYALYEAC